MRDSDIKYLYERAKDSHGDSIPDFAPKQFQELRNHFEVIFGHQSAIYPKSKRHKQASIDTVTAYYFYTSDCYLPPKIHRGTTTDTEPYEVEDLINTISKNNVSDTRNIFYYLLGDVGVGKTSLISYLITAKLSERVDNGTLWFVRIDLERISRDFNISSNNTNMGNAILKVPQRKDVARALCKKILDIYKAHKNEHKDFNHPNVIAAYNELNQIFKSSESNYRSYLDELCNFVSTIYEVSNHKRRLLVIFDNIDFLSHLNDRVIYHDYAKDSDLKVFRDIHNILSAFSSQDEIDKLGANILVVLRPYTFNILDGIATIVSLEKDSRNISRYKSFDQTFTLSPPDWQKVLHSRLDLLDFSFNYLEQKSKMKEFKEAIDNLTNLIDCKYKFKEKDLIEHLFLLSNKSLRTVISFLKHYSWIPKEDYQFTDTLKRFFKHVPIGLLSYCLWSKRRFNQFISEFPNIYLINKHGKIGDNDFKHIPTYWLKRLLLEFISFLSKECRAVRPEIIHNYFCKGEKCYEYDLVNVLLGSLGDVKSDCLLAERSLIEDDRLGIDNIRLKPRGEHCLTNVFDQFFYLQLIVDDYLLPIPKSVFSEFKFRNATFDNKPLDYRHLVLEGSEYDSINKEMIPLKVRQVLIFLLILEISWEFEKNYFSDTFKNLVDSGMILPDINKIKAEVMSGMGKISDKVPGKSAAHGDLKGAESLFQELKDEYDEKLRSDFKNIYEVVKIDGKM